MNIGVIVSGCRGKMGREVIHLVQHTRGVELVGEWYRDHIEEAQGVVIDFSSPDFLVCVLQQCLENRLPIVSGTTGLEKHHLATMKEISQEIPLLWSPNMSLGVAFMVGVLEAFGSLAQRADFQIEEWHHRKKKDSPSGTALWLQEELEKSVRKTLPPPLSVRGGGIFGVHKIMAMMEEETISLEHTALNRKIFAKGALSAATWLMSQRPGLYSLKEALFDRTTTT